MPKNILLLMTDQHRLDHVGFAPDSRMATPHIGRIAEGTAFINCISVNPICTPARTALLTGRYTHQIGTLAMSGDLSLQIPTYAQALQRAGYWTAGVGKFHFLQGWPWSARRGTGHDLLALRPEMKGYGFDFVWEAAGKQLALRNFCDYCAHMQSRGLLAAWRDEVDRRRPDGSTADGPQNDRADPWPFDEKDYVDIVTADRILKAIAARPAERPFFVFGSFCGPHPPYDPPARYLEMFPCEENDDFIGGERIPAEAKRTLWRKRRAYKAMVRCIDDQVGRILDCLQGAGLLDETVVLFTSDHGEMLGDHGRLQKQVPWRASVDVPTAIRHPDHLRGAVVTSPVELTDLAATMLDIAGLDPARALSKPFPLFNDIIPCRSLMPLVRGETQAVREFAFSECNGDWQMIQTERWKYVRRLRRSDPDAVREEFYDLVEDPQETRDRIGDPGVRDAVEWCRRRREFVMDTTPAAQTRWAPRIEEGA